MGVNRVLDPEEIVDRERIASLTEEEFQELLSKLHDRLDEARNRAFRLQSQAKERMIVDNLLELRSGHFGLLSVQVEGREVRLFHSGILVFHAELPRGSELWDVKVYKPGGWEDVLRETAEAERRVRLVSRMVFEILTLRNNFQGGETE